MAAGRLLVLVNRKASRVEKSVGAALGVLAVAGFDLDIRQPDGTNALCDLIREDGRHADAIVIAGGDGTVSCAVPALIEVRRPVGILPFGTANDLAATLGIPPDPPTAAEVIAAGHRRRIDVGRANDVHFLNVASIGLSVEVTKRQNPELKQQWGFLSYAIAALETLTAAERFRARVACDGETAEVEAFQVAVGNGVYYGGGLRVADDASIDDGLLDVYAIEAATVADLIAAAPALKTGSIGRRDDVTTFRGRTVRIETPSPMPVNTDGEITTETPVDFSVLEEALEVFVPAASVEVA